MCACSQHGDLKPQNVMLKMDANCRIGVVAKLTDFGLVGAHLLTSIQDMHAKKQAHAMCGLKQVLAAWHYVELTSHASPKQS